MKKLSMYLLMVGLSMATLTAQETEEETVKEDSSVKGQFETLIRKSGNYRANGKRYEVVNVIDLDRLQRNVLDSIKTANSSINDLNATIQEHENTISSLNSKLDNTTANLSSITEEKDSIDFFGVQIDKGTYKLIVWSIILTLIVFLAFFIYKFKNSNSLTQQAKHALADLEEEYEQHRRRSLEREQKISRKLQDEINKNKKGI